MKLTDFNTLTQQGNVDVFIRFDTALFQDPWVSLDQYHSRNFAPTGQDAIQPYRWKNTDFDTLLFDCDGLLDTDCRQTGPRPGKYGFRCELNPRIACRSSGCASSAWPSALSVSPHPRYAGA